MISQHSGYVTGSFRRPVASATTNLIQKDSYRKGRSSCAFPLLPKGGLLPISAFFSARSVITEPLSLVL